MIKSINMNMSVICALFSIALLISFYFIRNQLPNIGITFFLILSSLITLIAFFNVSYRNIKKALGKSYRNYLSDASKVIILASISLSLGILVDSQFENGSIASLVKMLLLAIGARFLSYGLVKDVSALQKYFSLLPNVISALCTLILVLLVKEQFTDLLPNIVFEIIQILVVSILLALIFIFVDRHFFISNPN